MNPASAYQKARRRSAVARGYCGQCCKRPRQEGRYRCAECTEINAKGTCECGNAKTKKRAPGCDSCMEIERQRKRAESTSGRILAAIDWHAGDWVAAADLADAICEDSVVVSSRLCYLTNSGEIEKAHIKGLGFVYRRARAEQRRAA